VLRIEAREFQKYKCKKVKKWGYLKWGLKPTEKIVREEKGDTVKTASNTNRSRGVWSGRERSEEAVGSALESAELSTAFKGAEDEFFGGSESEDAATRGCVKGAREEYVVGGVIEDLTPRSRPLALVAWEGISR